MAKKSNYYELMNTIKNARKEYKDNETLAMLDQCLSPILNGHMVCMFEGDLGAKYRIIVPYLDKKYVVFWFQFCKDGSLYFGVRDKISDKHHGSRTKSVDGNIIINMNEDVLPINETNKLTKDRFSFHGSGEIHSVEVGETTFREPILETREQKELFWVCFRELNNFEEIQISRKDDIDILVNVKEKHMLILHAFIAPSNKVQLAGINDGNNNHFLVINFPGTDSEEELALQFVFTAGPNAEVPDRSIVVWPTIEKDYSE